MTQQSTDQDQVFISEFFARYPWLTDETNISRILMDRWYQEYRAELPHTTALAAHFLKQVEKNLLYLLSEAQGLELKAPARYPLPVPASKWEKPGDLANQLFQAGSYGNPTAPQQVVEVEAPKTIDPKDPIPDMDMPPWLEQQIVNLITVLDPDAEIRSRLVIAYGTDIFTSIITATRNTWGADPMSVLVAVLLNVMGSFSELIFRFGFTSFMHRIRTWDTRSAGDLVLHLMYLGMALFVALMGGGGFIYNFSMTVEFFDNIAPAALVVFDIVLPISVGAMFGLLFTSIMTMIELEYLLNKVRKN